MDATSKTTGEIMFGIKKLQKDIEEIRNISLEMKAIVWSTSQRQEQIQRDLNQKLDLLKIEMSKINARFHDLGLKIDKTQENFDQLAQHEKALISFDNRLLDKITTDDAILAHLNEFSNKSTMIFNYMQQVEKIMNNVELIVDKCLPELTIKLPKKRKAITVAS